MIKALRQSRRNKLVMALRKRWGRSEPGEPSPAEISEYFQKVVVLRAPKHIVDDRTWSDLDMDLIFGRLNQTLTIPGEQVLYSLLRTPPLSREPLEDRHKLMGRFIEDRDLREKVQLALAKLSRVGGKYIGSLLWDERPAPNKLAFLYPWILLLVPLFVVWGLWGHSLGWIALGALSLANAVIHYRNKRKFTEDLPSIRYLGRLVLCAGRLSRLRDSSLEVYCSRLKSALDEVSGIVPRTALLSLGENNALYEYFNILFMIEVRAFHSYLKLMKNHESELREVFEIVGFLDAMVAAASYKAGLDILSKPEFTDSVPFLEIEDAVHPLVEKPVANSLSLRKGGMLVTGSNMSGKTTFLKTIGFNMVLAQSLSFCLARRFASSFFDTMTLIGRKDNIIEGKSYYLDEITSLLRIIHAAQQVTPCLCLIDELFRGTNSVERVSASVEALLYLAAHNALVFASTHDFELTQLVAGAYVNFHFEEEIGEGGLVFNYRLRKGPSKTRNAIKLLHHVGYPAEITEAAEKRIRGTS